MEKPLISFDFAIKYLLKDKGNYDIIEGFLSALLQEQGYKPVKIVALMDTESNREEYSQKKSLADLVVEDEEHNKYIIEVERQEVTDFIHKSCFNTSRLIADQLPIAGDYLKIKKVFHISLLYFRVGNGTVYHGKTIVKEVETQERLSIHIKDRNKENTRVYDAEEIFPEYIFICIPHFNDEIRKEFDEWLYVIKNAEVKPEFKSPCMRKVAEKLSVLKMDTETRNEYLHYMDEIATYKNAMETAVEKAKAEGKAEGLAEGETRGEAKGRAEGKQEVVTNMLGKGQSVAFIARVTGLTEEEVKKCLSLDILSFPANNPYRNLVCYCKAIYVRGLLTDRD